MSMDQKAQKKKRKRTSYTAEFKAGAIALVLTEKRPVAQVASDLGVSANSLHDWVRQARLDQGGGGNGRTTTDKEELARLQKEVRVLRMERDILKKAAAFFAKESA